MIGLLNCTYICYVFKTAWKHKNMTFVFFLSYWTRFLEQ